MIKIVIIKLVLQLATLNKALFLKSQTSLVAHNLKLLVSNHKKRRRSLNIYVSAELIKNMIFYVKKPMDGLRLSLKKMSLTIKVLRNNIKYTLL